MAPGGASADAAAAVMDHVGDRDESHPLGSHRRLTRSTETSGLPPTTTACCKCSLALAFNYTTSASSNLDGDIQSIVQHWVSGGEIFGICNRCMQMYLSLYLS
ncbi:hypothetical protein ZHAS_00017435 [Anopheles sinensis]|uniref:Uncharacterized protein n=1 Tax=Anopheles sinensis TaxID=74873 RepID=A0A084WGH4_ANOSI|nr:hypothetical protein ZHAS_00017435 [Anopheles sinensis]